MLDQQVSPIAPQDRSVRTLRIITVAALFSLFFIIIPTLCGAGIIRDHYLNQLGRYICFAIAAIGIDLIWGYTGLLSLGQAFFFCVGAYAMAMHLALPQGGGDVRPEYNMIPQFMFFNNVHSLDHAPFWIPFRSRAFAISAGIFLPAIVASIFGFFIFRSRVRGVYFSIITQAVAWGAWLLVSRNEMLLGGTNGLTNFYKPLNQSRPWIVTLYLASLTMLTLAYLACRWITRSSLGRVLVAVRDKETRLYFSGYRPYRFKVFAFAVAAVLAAIAGMLYAPQMGIITPARMKVEESIMMVIWVALGGRGRLWGAIFGALLVNYTYSMLTSDMPSAWPFIQGAMFLAVVLLFPQGCVVLWDRIEVQVANRAGALAILAAAGPLLAISFFILLEALGLMPHALRQDLHGIQPKYILLLIAIGGSAFASWRLRQSKLKQVTAVALAGAPLAIMEGGAS
ncbi:MAG TPA: urea ABC transporter permease subunit UrtC [Tepidisphaeraceae bacterium]|jgi:urea transport system permease protein|nr:urea ABC transporter permease subunit UrtC [Tepidisphaeraceae bacterium]